MGMTSAEDYDEILGFMFDTLGEESWLQGDREHVLKQIGLAQLEAEVDAVPVVTRRMGNGWVHGVSEGRAQGQGRAWAMR